MHIRIGFATRSLWSFSCRAYQLNAYPYCLGIRVCELPRDTTRHGSGLVRNNLRVGPDKRMETRLHDFIFTGGTRGGHAKWAYCKSLITQRKSWRRGWESNSEIVLVPLSLLDLASSRIRKISPFARIKHNFDTSLFIRFSSLHANYRLSGHGGGNKKSLAFSNLSTNCGRWSFA
jgi:hypothetical protein